MRINHKIAITKCSKPECSAELKDHMWNRIKNGWFFTKDGEKAYCPDHIPVWVESWRKQRGYHG